MSKANPRKAVCALLPVAIRGEGWEVRPLTLGIFAILERISSPLLEAGAKPQAMDLIPSLYVLTHDPMESLTGDLFAKSVAWADTLPPRALAEIRAAVMRQVKVVTDVVPEENVEKKKEQTDGSPSSPSGRPSTTTGRGTKLSGGAPQARSRSGTGSGDAPRATTR